MASGVDRLECHSRGWCGCATSTALREINLPCVPEDAKPALSSGRYAICKVKGAFFQVNSIPSRQMPCRITAILRAVATATFLKPLRALSRVAQDLRGELPPDLRHQRRGGGDQQAAHLGMPAFGPAFGDLA